MSSSHLHTSQKNDNNNINTNERYYCYRHKLDLKRNSMNSNESTMLENLQQMPTEEKQTIEQILSLFSKLSLKSRNTALEGLLHQCCSTQLSFLSNRLEDLNRIDFIAYIPEELSLHILSYLDATSLCRAAQVSKTWKLLADDDQVWHKLCEQHIDKKCYKCGWGLPLLEKRKHMNKRKILQNPSPPSSPPPSSTHNIKRETKRLCTASLRSALNWRSGTYNTRVLKGHRDGVTCLQFNEEKNILISGSYDATVRIWDIETGENVRTLKGHWNCVKTLQFDDVKLVTGSLDHTIKLWNYKTGQCIRTFRGHMGGVNSIHFNERILASGSADCTVRVWNFTSCVQYALRGHTDRVNCVRIYKQSRVLSSSDDCTIRVWDLPTKTCVRVFKGHILQIPSIEFASLSMFSKMFSSVHQESNNNNVDYGSNNNGDDGDSIVEQRCGGGNHENEDLPIIVSGSLDNTIKIWCFQSGKCCKTLFGHLEGVWTLALDKLRLVSGSQDNLVKIWDKDTGHDLHTLEGHSQPVTCVALSDTKIISGSDDKEIRIWDFKV
ncbi:13199_t:CDS:2 [Entrophospora sp. SA101]|nr:22249_t:CDS:2 [Entrophospora sp. SA101]CAJ0763266.1 13199_t:CDS:2 [Entrophospora sp. SA101]